MISEHKPVEPAIFSQLRHKFPKKSGMSPATWPEKSILCLIRIILQFKPALYVQKKLFKFHDFDILGLSLIGMLLRQGTELFLVIAA